MTLTLAGRWQTRTLLLSTLGLLVTLLWGLLYEDVVTPLVLLGYVLLVGYAWDALYYFLQTFRWNRDWPLAFAVAGGVVEGLFLWLLVSAVELPGVSSKLTALQYGLHYGTVWLATFAASLGVLPILFPRRRFHGGQWF